MAQTILTEASPPEKEALYGALGIYPDKNSALAELIDNSGEYGNTTTIRIVCTSEQIIISDNGAGLNPETMISMFRIKRNEHKQGETGKFGYGFKSATTFLGRGTTVLSRQNGNLLWGKAEPNDNWQYEIKPISPQDPEYAEYYEVWKKDAVGDNGTIIYIPHLKEEFSDSDLAKLNLFISETYALNFSQKRISVHINGNKVQYKKLFGNVYDKQFEKRQVKVNDVPFAISVYSITNETMKSKLTIVRNNRVISSGYSMGIPGIDEPAMTNYQVVLWCDDRLDDYLKMTPMKTISPNQAIDRQLRRAIVYDSGLSEEIKRIVEEAGGAQEVFVPLSQHTRMLNGLSETEEKLPASFKSYLNDREQILKRTMPKPAAPKPGQTASVQVVSRPKISAPPSIKVTTTSENYTNGLFNIDLKPLGQSHFMWDVEERMVNGKLQIVVVFNYDIPFIRGIISGPRNEVAKDLINEAIAQIIYSKITVDKSVESSYKNTYRNISRIKKLIFGG